MKMRKLLPWVVTVLTLLSAGFIAHHSGEDIRRDQQKPRVFRPRLLLSDSQGCPLPPIYLPTEEKYYILQPAMVLHDESHYPEYRLELRKLGDSKSPEEKVWEAKGLHPQGGDVFTFGVGQGFLGLGVPYRLYLYGVGRGAPKLIHTFTMKVKEESEPPLGKPEVNSRPCSP